MSNASHKDYVWNAISGGINAAEAVVMSMIVTRLGNLSDAGVLALAFAVGNVLLAIGKFGVRMFQVTDVRRQYSFRRYFLQRLSTVALMLLSLVAYLAMGSNSSGKREAIAIIAAIYMVEALEDCIAGHLQAMRRLYIGAQMFSFRWLAILTVFGVAMWATGDMATALFAGFLAGTLVFACYTIYLIRSGFFGVKSSAESSEGIVSLFRQTFALFLTGFCAIFISNVPKFAIDHYLNDEAQACYGFVAMPVFVIGLIHQFVYQPKIVALTLKYVNGRVVAFQRDVFRQLCYVAGISAICILGASLVGIPVLSFLYHVNLSGYWRELVILQVAGGFLAMAGFFSVLLTVLRKQKIIVVGYVAALLLGIVVIDMSVKAAGTIGASLGYTGVMALLFVFYGAAYRRIIQVRT